MLQHHRFAKITTPKQRGKFPPWVGQRVEKGGFSEVHAEQLPDGWLTSFSNSESVFFFSTSKLTSNGPMASGSGGAGLRVKHQHFVCGQIIPGINPKAPSGLNNGKMVWFHTTILVKISRCKDFKFLYVKIWLLNPI